MSRFPNLPSTTSLIGDYEQRLEALEYLLTVLETKLSRLKLALDLAPFTITAKQPILQRISDTEHLIQRATEQLASLRHDVSNLSEEAT